MTVSWDDRVSAALTAFKQHDEAALVGVLAEMQSRIDNLGGGLQDARDARIIEMAQNVDLFVRAHKAIQLLKQAAIVPRDADDENRPVLSGEAVGSFASEVLDVLGHEPGKPENVHVEWGVQFKSYPLSAGANENRWVRGRDTVDAWRALTHDYLPEAREELRLIYRAVSDPVVWEA